MASTLGRPNCIFSAVKVKLRLDKRGRMLLPKRLRDAMAISPGTKLEIEIVGSRLELQLANLNAPPHTASPAALTEPAHSRS